MTYTSNKSMILIAYNPKVPFQSVINDWTELEEL
jgi:hypothetical protein